MYKPKRHWQHVLTIVTRLSLTTGSLELFLIKNMSDEKLALGCISLLIFSSCAVITKSDQPIRVASRANGSWASSTCRIGWKASDGGPTAADSGQTAKSRLTDALWRPGSRPCWWNIGWIAMKFAQALPSWWILPTLVPSWLFFLSLSSTSANLTSAKHVSLSLWENASTTNVFYCFSGCHAENNEVWLRNKRSDYQTWQLSCLCWCLQRVSKFKIRISIFLECGLDMPFLCC